MKKLLVLGGTGEACAIVDALRDKFADKISLVYSLAGVTDSPHIPENVEVMQGGFGGLEGLRDYTKTANIEAIIDATHPFAITMTRTAYDVSTEQELPFLRIERELWQPEEGDEWSEVTDMASAAFYVPRFGSRCMLAIGSRELHLFQKWTRVFFLIRTMVYPEGGVLPFENYSLLVDKTINDMETEKNLMEEHGIEVLVCRNSGGAATAAKLLAARALKIPVIMVKRPPSIGGDVAYDMDDLMAWCDSVIV